MKEKETIEYLDLKSLVPFRNHPFKLRGGEEKEQLLQSIRTQGAIEPLIVRPLSESEYESYQDTEEWRFTGNLE